MKSRIHKFNIKKGIIFSSSKISEIQIIKTYCTIKKIELCILNSDYYSEKIKDIADKFSFYNSEKEDESNEQFLVICGFNNTEIHNFLNTVSDKGLNIPLKCVATEINSDFSIKECIECIKEERRQLNQD